MNIIIVGCGKIGQSLAEQLSEDHNDITVVDVSPEKVKEVSTRLDVLGVTGNGATLAVQEEAGIANADLLIAVTGSDELNLLGAVKNVAAENLKTAKNETEKKGKMYFKLSIVLGLAAMLVVI